jgi:hypothetical protein
MRAWALATGAMVVVVAAMVCWHALTSEMRTLVEQHLSATTPAAKRRFWQFVAVTSPGNVANKAVVVQRTWGSAIHPPLRWYTDNETALLPEAVIVRDPTYLEAAERGEGYKFMTFKMQVRSQRWCDYAS